MANKYELPCFSCENLVKLSRRRYEELIGKKTLPLCQQCRKYKPYVIGMSKPELERIILAFPNTRSTEEREHILRDLDEGRRRLAVSGRREIDLDRRPTHEPPSKDLEPIDLSKIRADPEVQCRLCGVSDLVVDDYAEALGRGAKLPAVIVYHDGDTYWLADGFHRLRAHHKARHTMIEAVVLPGGKRDAILCAISANSTHGLQRSPSDKRMAVERLLRDPEWCKWSDRRIAKLARVGYTLVSDVRLHICPPRADVGRTVLRGKQRYQMHVSRIGATKSTDEKTSVEESTGDACAATTYDTTDHTTAEDALHTEVRSGASVTAANAEPESLSTLEQLKHWWTLADRDTKQEFLHWVRQTV